MTILIVTDSKDKSISALQKEISDRGQNSFRFDIDAFPTEVGLEIQYSLGHEQIILFANEEKLILDEVSTVWNRFLRNAAKNETGALIPPTIESQFRNPSIQESCTMLEGMLASLNTVQVDPLSNQIRANNKQLQLQTAQNLSIDIPRTLITNNPEAVRNFSQECQHGLITKMLSRPIIDDHGQEKIFYTNPVSPEILNNLDRLRFCPMVFQEQIPKALELRITIVGKQVFTAAVDSQRYQTARYDWRRGQMDLRQDWRLYHLPQGVEAKLLQLMDYFELQYGAMDIILTPDDRYIFLEVNPVGEFYWLEQVLNLPITKAVSDLLIQTKENF